MALEKRMAFQVVVSGFVITQNLGEMIQFDSYFSIGLKPLASFCLVTSNCGFILS